MCVGCSMYLLLHHIPECNWMNEVARFHCTFARDIYFFIEKVNLVIVFYFLARYSCWKMVYGILEWPAPSRKAPCQDWWLLVAVPYDFFNNCFTHIVVGVWVKCLGLANVTVLSPSTWSEMLSKVLLFVEQASKHFPLRNW